MIAVPTSGPEGSAYDAPARPPDQSCPIPCTVHDSASTRPPGSLQRSRVHDRPPCAPPVSRSLTTPGARPTAERTTASACPGATVRSASPCTTISGTGPASATAVGGDDIAANADPASRAARYGSPEWTPAPQNKSGWG